MEALLEVADGLDLQRIEVSLRARVDRNDLQLDVQRRELRLLQELDHALAAGRARLRRLVEVRAELGEGRQVRYCASSRRRDPATCFMAFDLCLAADAGNRETRRSRRAGCPR